MSVDTTSPPIPPRDAANVRDRLEQEMREREDTLRQLAPSAGADADPVSLAMTATTRQVLDRLSAAITRLEAGRYGRCLRCGDAILAARLEVLPYAETCIDCQNSADRS